MAINQIKIVSGGVYTVTLDHLCLTDDDDFNNMKHLIQNLVHNYGKKETEKPPDVQDLPQDFVESKGKGLVILLHGSSGIGKTLTAQIVALVTGKPLLKVSVSDTGVGVTKAEQNLNTIFLLASAWEAVLLFDEADIPLEARAIEDNLARNSMVSLFLKVLEYYEGILFFTSNCIKIFDITV